MADYDLLFQLILAALTFVIIGMFFIVYLMIIGLREKNKLKTEGVSIAKEETQEECPHFFGYLAGYPLNEPIPEECFGCIHAIKCMNERRPLENATEGAEPPQRQ